MHGCGTLSSVLTAMLRLNGHQIRKADFVLERTQPVHATNKAFQQDLPPDVSISVTEVLAMRALQWHTHEETLCVVLSF